MNSTDCMPASGVETSSGAALTVWRSLLLGQLRDQPLRLALTVIAIALGVALGSAVYLVNSAALNEFGLATKRLVGEADIVIRGPRAGFREGLFVELARDPSILAASPVLELDVALGSADSKSGPGKTGNAPNSRDDVLKIVALDPFRAALLQPAIIGDIGADVFELFQPDALFLSASAAQQLNVHRGESLRVTIGDQPRLLRVIGVLSPETYSQPLGVMDIASAQWTLQRLGVLNRIDLRLAPGVDVESFRRQLAARLPPGVLAIAPQVERDRAVSVTRAYRVNLNMLALVSLWTGAFLVFATQSLAVLRRRRTLALLRALGVTRGELQRALLGEGAALGAVGGVMGVIAGFCIAATLLHWLTGDLGNGQLRAVGASVRSAPLPILGFIIMGILVASAGAWIPARNASRRAPATALKGGDQESDNASPASAVPAGAVATRVGHASTRRGGSRAGLLMMLAGAGLALLPPVWGLPLFGYAAVAALLWGAMLMVPALTLLALRWTPATRHVILDTAIAQLRENVALSTLSLASVIVSFSLMVAMAIMVHSFRVSFDHWLSKVLPADLQLREPNGNDTAYWSVQDQTRLASAAGVARAEFRRTGQVLLDPGREPVTLIARGASDEQTQTQLPLVQTASPPHSPNLPSAWVSEAIKDIYGYRVGASLPLPIGGTRQTFYIAGIWRDYARTSGAIVITRPAYLAASGDSSANEASMWLRDGVDAAATIEGLRARLPGNGSMQITTTVELHARSLQIFDRAFLITYALEAIAVLIGLTGVSFAASSTALARRVEFGMLRHIGMLRSQVVAMLASEGLLTSAFGALYGLAVGMALSLVLVYVVNRQSFNWSIDLSIPVGQLALLSIALIAASALTSMWSGRAAMGAAAVQAVREDW